MELSTNVQFFLELQAQLRILHWQTKGYPRHIAFGGIYSDMDELIDEFVETSMGKKGRFVLDESTSTLKIQNLKEISIVPFLQGIKEKLIGFTEQLDPVKDTDLLNIRDEMLGKFNKLAYLLTLD